MSDTEIELGESSFLANGDDGNGRSVETDEEREPLRIAKTKADRLGGDASAARPAGRSRTWLVFALLGVAAVGGGTAYYFWTAGYESTDDAFIAGHVVPVSSRVAGHVAKVYVDDNQRVKKGDLLVELDPADFQTRVAAAEAAMDAAKKGQRFRSIGTDVTEITSAAGVDEAAAAVEGAKAEVETARAAVSTAQSQLAEARAMVTAAGAGLQQAHLELRAATARRQLAGSYLHRIQELVPGHAASQENLDEAVMKDEVAQADAAAGRQRVSAQEAAVQQAEAAVTAAESALRQAKAAVDARDWPAGIGPRPGSPPPARRRNRSPKAAPKATSPDSTPPAPRPRSARPRSNLSYTKIYAPVDGHVTRKDVERGAYVQVGQPLLALVEPNVWVVANFKETQLTHMRVGQPVSVEVDAYPEVKFAAHVESFQRGSGAYFSLLPPENATGNYVKVVQRVPVKIVFDDPQQVEKHALGPGMSVTPRVTVAAAAASAGGR